MRYALGAALGEAVAELRPVSERLLAAYAEVWPLDEGRAERVGLWQLFPLLVHAVLFGGGYGARAARIAERYLRPPSPRRGSGGPGGQAGRWRSR